jgi:hypothetical protein
MVPAALGDRKTHNSDPEQAAQSIQVMVSRQYQTRTCNQVRLRCFAGVDAAERFVPEGRRRCVANVAAFYADAAPVARRLIWDQSDRLEAFGIVAGAPTEGIRPLLEAVRANLGHLNETRAEVLRRSRSGHPRAVSWSR